MPEDLGRPSISVRPGTVCICPSSKLLSVLPSFAFFAAALVLAVTPGPGIAYVVARTAAGGRADRLASCVGTFLPQFLVRDTSVVVQLVVMGTVCVVLNTLVDVAAVLGAARLLGSEASARQRAMVLNKVSGLTLVGLGLYVAASRRSA